MKMFIKDDTTYNDIRKKSLEQWLAEMEDHEDMSVKGGIPLVRGYIDYLIMENKRLEAENKLKNEYLKKLAGNKR